MFLCVVLFRVVVVHGACGRPLFVVCSLFVVCCPVVVCCIVVVIVASCCLSLRVVALVLVSYMSFVVC